MKRFLAAMVSFLVGATAFSCTTFCIERNGQIVFGRNYDWVTGEGIVFTNHRGLIKTSDATEDGTTIKWVSLYGSISFNQYGKEFPMGGMNEKGLVVELMWLDGTQYPAPDSRPSVNVLQWVQFQLDNAATVDEVIASDKKLRIASNGTPLHYLVADAKGNVASIEFLNGKMVIHRGNSLPFPVLANSTYSESAQTAKSYMANNSDPSHLDNSLERYVKACRMVKQVDAVSSKQSLTDYSFTILKQVSQGNFTRWSIVYDITNKKISFKTNSHPTIKALSLSSFDFSCSAEPKMFNMNQRHSGDIDRFFGRPDKALAQDILEKAIRESSERVTISEEEKERILRYEKTTVCETK